MYGPVDLLLQTLERGSFASAQDAAAAVLACAFRLNEEVSRILSEQEREQRLRQWVEQLMRAITGIANTYPDLAFSVSVGWPPSVTVTVGWRSASDRVVRPRPKKGPTIRIPDEPLAPRQQP